MGARHPRRRRSSPKLLRRWLRQQDRFTRGLLVGVVALSVVIVALTTTHRTGERRDTNTTRVTPPGVSGSPAAERRATAALIPASRSHRTRPAPEGLPSPKAPAAAAPRTDARWFIEPRVAIVIDDLGQSLSQFEQVAGLNLTLSIAVIPGLPASTRTVKEASRRGIELLLHQPMEPQEEGGKNPGEGVLLTSMSAESLRAQVRANLALVPGAVGVNNHMGSKFTEDAAGLGALMAELKEHQLFWLDSRTTAGTRGLEIARAAAVPALERDIFIDAEVDADFIRRQVRKLIDVARGHGTAVGIGHPHPETIAALRELRGELLASGVTFVPVSTLAREQPASESGTALAAAFSGKERSVAPAGIRKTALP